MQQILIQTDPGDEQEFVVGKSRVTTRTNVRQAKFGTFIRLCDKARNPTHKIDIESTKDDIEDD